MSLRETLVRQIDGLSDAELAELADYLAYLRFKALRARKPLPTDDELARLYAEAAQEDRALAEQGMGDYVAGLAQP